MNKIKERFIQNAKGFLSSHRWVLALFCIALLADGISTIRFMLAEGVDTEMHPVVNSAAQIAGPVMGPLIAVAGKAVAGMIVAVYWRRIAPIILLVVTIVSFWAAWYNTWGWQYYEPGIIKWWPF